MAFFDPKNRQALRDEAKRDTELALERQRQEEERKKALHKSTLDSRIRHLEDSIRRIEPRINIIKSELSAIERESHQAERAGVASAAEKTAAEHREIELTRQIHAEEVKLRSLETKETSLRREVERETHEIASKDEHQKSAARDEKSRLEKETGDAKRDKEIANIEKLRLVAEVERLKRELATKENDLRKLESRIAEDDKTARELAQRAKGVQSGTGHNRSDNVRLEREKHDLEKTTSDKNEELKRIQALKAETEALKQRLRSLETKQDYSGGSRDTHKRIAKQRELESLERELAGAREELSRLERERQAIR
jgi:chromosome segregation ATPase